MSCENAPFHPGGSHLLEEQARQTPWVRPNRGGDQIAQDCQQNDRRRPLQVFLEPDAEKIPAMITKLERDFEEFHRRLSISRAPAVSPKAVRNTVEFCAYFAKQWLPSAILNSWCMSSRHTAYSIMGIPLELIPTTNNQLEEFNSYFKRHAMGGIQLQRRARHDVVVVYEIQKILPISFCFRLCSARSRLSSATMRQGHALGASPSTGTALIGCTPLAAPACVDNAAVAAPATPLPLLAIGTSSVVPSSGAQQDADGEAIFLSERDFALVSCTENTVVVLVPSQVPPGHTYLCSFFPTRMPACNCPKFCLGANGNPAGGCVDPCKHIGVTRRQEEACKYAQNANAAVQLSAPAVSNASPAEEQAALSEQDAPSAEQDLAHGAPDAALEEAPRQPNPVGPLAPTEAGFVSDSGDDLWLHLKQCHAHHAWIVATSQAAILRISRYLGSLNSDVDPDAEVDVPQGELLADFA
ncbi:hypothetical protein BDK51DRAFT_29323 [Blyttiomyces helicus]|uniref:Uncharacterized protein n=1 Tax=Blyttiomyces helicus TaxID=388810 RepID=A0A4P9WA04_9FUNG|nr:hypothetical protein BDK51DRAFT_29323 [Blyttiomyces helicus]|eukprot:RKO88323.1 hypothetical protein BDK51DRAFT_29323 [Blyttiomyces helicus]